MNNFAKYFLACVVVFLFFTCSFAQDKKTKSLVAYDYSFDFSDGLYASFYDFRNNSPIPFEHIVSPAYDDNFFKNLLKCEMVSYYDHTGALNDLPRNLIWGYANNGKPYIYNSGKFNLIPYIGTISHFMTTIVVTHFVDAGGTMMYSGFYAPSTQSYTTEELVHYFIDLKTGDVIPYNSKSLLELIKDDAELYEEYSKLGKRKRAKSIMDYMQKYNRKHTIMFNTY